MGDDGSRDESARDEGVETLLGTGLEEPDDPLVDALRAVAELREALRRGDTESVRPKLDLHAYGAGARGVLSTLAGTRSVEEAVNRLGPFWKSAEYRMDAARVVSPDEVEVYETVIASEGALSLRTLTLLRRRGGHWRQVTTMDAPDEKLVAALICDEAQDPSAAALTQAFADTEWDTAVRVAGPPTSDRVRDRRLREPLEGAASVVSVATMAPRDRRAREELLRSFANGVASLGAAIAARAVYLPWNERLLSPAQLEIADPRLDGLAARWVNVIVAEGWTGTRGMSHFMLPELETRWIDWPSEDVATQIVVRAAEDLRDGAGALEVRTDVDVAGTRCRVDYGRRGAALGQTYGRYGSVRLAPSRV